MSCVHKWFKFGGFVNCNDDKNSADKDGDNADDSIQANSKIALGMMIVMIHIWKDCTLHDDSDESHLISGWWANG